MMRDRPPRSGTRLPAPEDGIVASLRAKGWLALRWQAMLERLPAKHQGRIGNGRAYARSARVRDLWFSPGLANAEVWGSERHLVSVRFRVLADSEWARITKVLLEDLRLVGSMLEGELPAQLLERLEAHDIHLLPLPQDLGGDCDCGDFLLPCEHMAAVHHLLADALDGDPFLLPTLRGRTREQLLAQLRAAWKDDRPMLTPGSPPSERPPAGDWFTSPAPARITFSVHTPKHPALGLRALGPAPGGGDLEKALLPLYEAGGETARRIAFGEEEVRAERAIFRRRGTEQGVYTEEGVMSDGEQGATAGTVEMTEQLVDLLAEMESAKSGEIAERLGLDPNHVRAELLELEKLGIVYRTGRTRGTRWWLG